MKTIVTFTGNRVQVLCGSGAENSITIEKKIDVEFSVNCVINGVITDVDVFAEGIKTTWEEHNLPKKDIILAVDGNHIRSRQMNVPAVGYKQIKKIILNEFSDNVMTVEEQASAYMLLSKENGQAQVLAMCAEKTYILELQQAFEKAGVKLGYITSVRCGIINTLNFVDDVKEKDCIVLSLQGEVLSSILIEQGKYVNLSTVRLFTPHGSEGFGGEVTRNVSQLMQFQSSQRSEHPAKEVFFLGFSDEDYDVSAPQVKGLGLSANTIAEGGALIIKEGTLAETFSHAGIFVLADKSCNLMAETSTDAERIKERDRKLLTVLPILALCAILAIFTSTLTLKNNKKQQQLDSLQTFVGNELNRKAYDTYSGGIESAAELNSNKATAQRIRDAIDSYPYAMSSLGDTISKCGTGIADVNIRSYDSISGTINFTAVGTDPTTINEFIKALNETGLFMDVEYSGYQLLSDGESYNINVSCSLNTGAGK
ncbi:MAG: hypothetical protein Q4C42_02355 [Clostridia bacterium]|nr:hypothetical protein [Clostridia bacterium]